MSHSRTNSLINKDNEHSEQDHANEYKDILATLTQRSCSRLWQELAEEHAPRTTDASCNRSFSDLLRHCSETPSSLDGENEDLWLQNKKEGDISDYCCIIIKGFIPTNIPQTYQAYYTQQAEHIARQELSRAEQQRAYREQLHCPYARHLFANTHKSPTTSPSRSLSQHRRTRSATAFVFFQPVSTAPTTDEVFESSSTVQQDKSMN